MSDTPNNRSIFEPIHSDGDMSWVLGGFKEIWATVALVVEVPRGSTLSNEVVSRITVESWRFLVKLPGKYSECSRWQMSPASRLLHHVCWTNNERGSVFLSFPSKQPLIMVASQKKGKKAKEHARPCRRTYAMSYMNEEGPAVPPPARQQLRKERVV